MPRWKLRVSLLKVEWSLQFIKMICAPAELWKETLEIIGEALNKIVKRDSTVVITGARAIIDTRNRIIHGYDTVSDSQIWDIITNDLPILQEEVRVLLDE